MNEEQEKIFNLAVDLIQLLELNKINNQDAIKALKIVIQDFENKIKQENEKD